jgi:hypothetical protein
VTPPAVCPVCEAKVATRVDLVSLVFAKHYHRGEVCVGSGRRVAYRTEEEIRAAHVNHKTPPSDKGLPAPDFADIYGFGLAGLREWATDCRKINEWLRDEGELPR